MSDSRVILAADELDLELCVQLLAKIGHRLAAVKIHNLYDLHGVEAIRQLRRAGGEGIRIWVDAKLHDIPNTVGRRAWALCNNGADIITVHASGEIEMMMEAVVKAKGLEIYAITVLTSLDEDQTQLIYGNSVKAKVLYFARLAKLAGVHGMVCSPKEVEMLAKRPELKGLKLIVPGIRSAGKDAGDQKRFDTPSAAIKAGATYLVVGRQLTQAPDPILAIDELEAEIAGAAAGC